MLILGSAAPQPRRQVNHSVRQRASVTSPVGETVIQPHRRPLVTDSGTRDVGADSRPPSDRPASQSIELLPHTRDMQGAKQSRGYPRGTERERSPEQPGPKGNAQTPIPNSRNEQSSPALTVEDTVG